MERAFLKGLGLETLTQTTGFGSGWLPSTASRKNPEARHAEAASERMNSFKAKPGAGESAHCGPAHQGAAAPGVLGWGHREPDLSSAAGARSAHGDAWVSPETLNGQRVCRGRTGKGLAPCCQRGIKMPTPGNRGGPVPGRHRRCLGVSPAPSWPPEWGSHISRRPAPPCSSGPGRSGRAKPVGAARTFSGLQCCHSHAGCEPGHARATF